MPASSSLQPLPPLPPLEEEQCQWKQNFWKVYRQHWPIALIGYVLPAIGVSWYLGHLLGALAGGGFAALAAAMSPIVALFPALAVSGPYPTAHNRKKLEELRAVFQAVREQEAAAEASKSP